MGGANPGAPLSTMKRFASPGLNDPWKISSSIVPSPSLSTTCDTISSPALERTRTEPGAAFGMCVRTSDHRMPIVSSGRAMVNVFWTLTANPFACATAAGA